MHLFSSRCHDKLAVIFNSQLFQTEEAHVCEDGVEDDVVAVGADRVALVEFLNEQVEEVLIADAPVEDLLDEHFLVRVLHVFQEVVCVRVDSVDDGVKGLDALLAVVE